MIRHVLSKKDFPVREFLHELEKRELLFLLFLVSHDKEEEVDFIYQHTDDMEQFFRTLEKTVGKRIKKLPKDELIEQIATQYEDTSLTTSVYKNIYQHSLDSDSVLFHSKLMALEHFTSMNFSKKIEKIQSDYITGKFLKKHNVLEEFKKKMIHPQKPVSNTLGLVSLLGKVDFALQHFMDNPVAYEFKEVLICLLIEQFGEVEKNQLNKIEDTFRKQEIALKNKEKDCQRKEESLSKVKEQNRQLSMELKQLKKEVAEIQSTKKEEKKGEIDHELINQLYMDIQKKDKQLEQYAKEIKQSKEKPNTLYNTLIEKLQDQLATAKAQDREKSLELKNIKNKINSLESKTIETHLQEYIDKNGFTERLFQLIDPFMKKYVYEAEKKKEQVSLQEQEEEELKKEQKIGYCLVENDIHYVVFPDGSRIEIKEIPTNIYLGEWQFVKVETDGTFKWLYSFKYDENERDYQIHEFGSVIYKNNEPYFMKAVWDDRKLEKVPSYVNLKENQVVSVNGKGELLRFYRSIRHNLDYYMPSIKAKGQEAYYVLKIVPNGMLVRNVETEIEEFKHMDTNGQEVKEQQIICVEDNKIVHVYYSTKFYTFSSFYKKAEHGVAELKQDMVFVRKLSGEVAIVNNIPDRLKIAEGDIITVDECNNYMMMKKADTSSTETDERKKLQSTPKTTSTKKSVTDKIKVEKEVLVLGKITYENSYKMSLFKKGYRAEVIEGYEPWTKVKSSLKGKDIVVVVTDYISHDNMWRIKDEELTIPVIYSEFDGANRIVEQIEEMFDNEKAM